MDSIISTFHIDWKLIIAQAVNFAVVFSVLYLFALKPLSKLMAERSEKIAKGIDDAKNNDILINKTRADYEDVLVKARAEANALFQESKKESEAKRILILEQAKSEVTVMIENGRKTLEAEKMKMVAEAKKDIVSVAVKITEKLIGNKIDASFDEKTLKELNDIS